MNLFDKLKEGLAKTRQGLAETISSIIHSHGSFDEDLYEELEEVLIQADVGVNTSLELVGRLRDSVREKKLNKPEEVELSLKEELKNILNGKAEEFSSESRPLVILVVGVNGVGKTTTIGKLAYRFKNEGKKVLLAAGDTYRAAAIEQLEAWGRRTGVDVIRQQIGSDPAAVAFDALQAARARNVDVLLIDTAGRLHTKRNLMEELKKINRVMARECPGAPQEVLLILDATTGHNALSQAKLFGEAVGVTGIILTKLDGTAKGGIVVAIKNELDIPVKFIGIGEKVEDLQLFNADKFVEALFS